MTERERDEQESRQPPEASAHAPEDGQDERDQGTELPSLPRRILLLFTSPSKLFRALGQRPSALGALVLGGVLVAVAALAIPVELLEAELRDQLLRMDQDLPTDPAMAARVGKVASIFGALVAWPLMGAVAAGIYTLLFAFGMGYEGRYRQYLSVAAHAFLVAALGTLAVTPLRLVVQDSTFSLTVGLLLPLGEEGFLAAFADSLELFNLWVHVLVGIGAATIAGKERAGPAVAASLGLVVLLALVVAAFTF